MGEYLSPGVYIKEVSMGARPIEGVSTSTAGFVGVVVKKLLTEIEADLNTPDSSSIPATFKTLFDTMITALGDARTAELTKAYNNLVTDVNQALEKIDALKAVDISNYSETNKKIASTLLKKAIQVGEQATEISESHVASWRNFNLGDERTTSLTDVDEAFNAIYTALDEASTFEENSEYVKLIQKVDTLSGLVKEFEDEINLIADTTEKDNELIILEKVKLAVKHIQKIVQSFKPTFISSWAHFISQFGRYTKENYLAPAVYSFFANGGKRCYVVGVADEGSIVGEETDDGVRTGLQSLKEIDDVSILCIPGITDDTVQLEMITHCADMGDRFCIFDSKIGENLEKIQERKNKLISDKGIGALYYPWIKTAVEKKDYTGKVVLENMLIPPSGAMAGIYARSDTERGVHKAPANEVVRGVLELERTITKAEQDILNPKNINCIRAFQGRGIRVWGARTIAPKGSEWKYINVRRLFLFLEESIDESTQWVVFEPNNEALWARVVQTISNFLLGIWKSGALMGTSPEEAFFVKCDRSTMTQDDIDNGKLIVLVGLAATKPAEFVIFKIGQWTADSNN